PVRKSVHGAGVVTRLDSFPNAGIPMHLVSLRLWTVAVLCTLSFLTAIAACPAAEPAGDAAVAKALEAIHAVVTTDAEGNIVGVDLSKAEFTGEHLAMLKSLPHLTSVAISGSSFTDANVPALAGLTQLKQLVIENTEMSDAGLAQLTDLPALRLLNVRRNSRLTDAGLEGLSQRFPQLEQLHLLFNNITDDALAHVAPFEKLKVLDLR